MKSVVVIPAYAEYDYIFKTLDSLRSADGYEDVQVFVVINNSDNAKEEIVENNFMTFEKIKQQYTEVHVLDYFSKGKAFPDRLSGVGISRKTGVAVSIANSEDEVIILSLDADTTVEKNYLFEINRMFNRDETIVGLTIDAHHEMPEDTDERDAIVKYEIYLRYYYTGMQFTGSPLSLWAIGSSIAFLRSAYLSVGGFSSRKAGEDFYFLQKLREFGKIAHIYSTRTHPSGRISCRVPFGTGKNINDIISNRKILNEFPDHANFIKLKNWFNSLKNWAEGGYKQLYLPGGSLEKFLRERNGIEAIFSIYFNTSTPESFLKRYHFWLNGLRIRQYLNYDGRKEKIPDAVKFFWDIEYDDLQECLLTIRDLMSKSSDI